MSYTATQLQALKSALANGALIVRYEDRMVTYRSVEELTQAIQIVEGELAAASGTARHSRSFARFSKG